MARNDAYGLQKPEAVVLRIAGRAELDLETVAHLRDDACNIGSAGAEIRL